MSKRKRIADSFNLDRRSGPHYRWTDDCGWRLDDEPEFVTRCFPKVAATWTSEENGWQPIKNP